jgi:Protein of unknown function (DUF1580)
MPIRLKDEEVLTLSQAAEVLPSLRGGRPVHRSTLYRWISRGVRGIRLETLRLGRTLVTSQEALQRFAERLAGLDQQPALCPLPASRRVELAEQELERRGL